MTMCIQEKGQTAARPTERLIQLMDTADPSYTPTGNKYLNSINKGSG